MRISFLHTSAKHIALFDALLAAEPNVTLAHHVRESWLQQAADTGLVEPLVAEVTTLLTELADHSAAVVCTCSSLGPVAQRLRRPNVFRIDEPMMAAAVSNAPVLLVVCLDSTIKASSQLLEAAFLAEGKAPDYRVLRCPEAWPHFENDDRMRFAQRIAASVNAALRADPSPACVVLAQASMLAAVEYLDGIAPLVLSSPALAAQRALAMGSSR